MICPAVRDVQTYDRPINRPEVVFGGAAGIKKQTLGTSNKASSWSSVCVCELDRWLHSRPGEETVVKMEEETSVDRRLDSASFMNDHCFHPVSWSIVHDMESLVQKPKNHWTSPQIHNG